VTVIPTANTLIREFPWRNVSRTSIALVLCLLVAGCAAPTAQTQDPAAGTNAPITTDGSTAVDTTSTGETIADETTAGEVEDDGISVSGGSLPVEPEGIFDRTTALLGANVSPPPRIAVRSAAAVEADTDGTATTGDEPGARSFGGVIGIGASDEDGAGGDDSAGDGSGDDESKDGSGDDESKDGSGGGDSDDESGDDGVSVAAYAPSANSVVVNERMTVAGRERALERTLAHEFVHTVQFRQNALERVQRELDLRYSYSLDRYLTYVSVVEGIASFVADAYDEQYLAGEGTGVVSTERYRSAPSGVKVSLARYYFGSRYVASRFDSPQNVSQLYDDPPRTTEQLLHEDANASEEPRFLALQVRPGENRTVGQRDTNGELFTRIALGTELNESRAAGAAAGWGGDELAAVEPERGSRNRSGNRSFAWATRWDSSAEADEFAAALAAYLDSRADRVAAGGSTVESDRIWRDGPIWFRTERVDDETVVLLVGEKPFVRSATVSGSNASVSVSA
jgi:hypothetical protein